MIDELLLEIEKSSENIPIIGPIKGRVLYILTLILKPRRILELGTAIGYSTLIMAKAVKGRGKILTVERDYRLAQKAKDNFKKVGLNRKIEIIVGEAVEEIKRIKGRFDLIFLDIEKKDYYDVLEDCIKLLKRGGVLVADNVLWDELKDFRSIIMNHPKLESLILEVKDGMSISVKKF
ncbi:Putative O-methyltransferase [archaeon HR06]|nr:Putative O-methyltransferase [archaeon HR06]